MRPVVLDLETYFDDNYTLSKLSTEEYVRHEKFEAHGAAIKWSRDTLPQWYDARELAYVLKEEDWSDVFLVAHHCQFDGLILSHHYKIFPKMYGCTLSMARLVIGNHISVSLANLAKHFSFAPKTIDYFSFKGKHWHELTVAQQEAIADGCCRDVEITWNVFQRLLRGEADTRRTQT